MRGSCDLHRLRKYRRWLARRWDDRVAMLAWRYHMRVHGSHGHLWGKPVETRR